LIRLERIPSHWLKNTNLVLPIQGCQSWSGQPIEVDFSAVI
jgi:hypothetical protein